METLPLADRWKEVRDAVSPFITRIVSEIHFNTICGSRLNTICIKFQLFRLAYWERMGRMRGRKGNVNGGAMGWTSATLETFVENSSSRDILKTLIELRQLFCTRKHCMRVSLCARDIWILMKVNSYLRGNISNTFFSEKIMRTHWTIQAI